MGGLEDPVAKKRAVKATRIVRWLLRADVTCRACRRPIRRNAWGEWIDDQSRSKTCRADGFQRARLQVEHRPDVWTVDRLAAAPPAERERIRKAAGVKRRCSPETWAEVVKLYQARTGGQ